jgi:hypothetical protein
MRRHDTVLESIEPEAFIASASFECMTEAQPYRIAAAFRACHDRCLRKGHRGHCQDRDS